MHIYSDDFGTAEKVLSSSVVCLKLLGLTEHDARQIKSIISKEYAKPFITGKKEQNFEKFKNFIKFFPIFNV